MSPEDHVAGTGNLLAYLEGDPDDGGIKLMADVVDHLVSERAHRPGDEPLFVNEGMGLERTVGVLVIMPHPSADPVVERYTLGRVEALVAALETVTRGVTRGTGHVVAVELDGQVVGWIDNGERDRLLQEGLIEPWRRWIDRAK